MSDHIPDAGKMDTPRTDSWHCLSVAGLKVVPASFARQLERELDDMTAFRDSEMRWANQYKKERDTLTDALKYLIEGLSDLANALNSCHDGPTASDILRWDRIGYAKQVLDAVKG
jgi:hypothetical protein